MLLVVKVFAIKLLAQVNIFKWQYTLKKNFMALFYGWGSESTLEPPSGFEHGTPGMGIQRLDHQAIEWSRNIYVVYFLYLKD